MKTFKETALEHMKTTRLSPKTTKQQAWLADKLADLHDIPVADITAPQLLAIARGLESKGQMETAHRVVMFAGRILRFAIGAGYRAERDVAADLDGLLIPVRAVSHPAIIDPAALGAFLRAADAYDGSQHVRRALRLAPRLFVRPSELRRAVWSEFDLAGREWRIPAERMKMRRPLVVPLATQVCDILNAAARESEFVFPGRAPGTCLSENMLSLALRRMMYDRDEVSMHGFRSTASTLLHEGGWESDLIELQLAHVVGPKTARVYDRSQRLEERRDMMQWWSDYLSGLAGGGL
jgi:integrase